MCGNYSEMELGHSKSAMSESVPLPEEDNDDIASKSKPTLVGLSYEHFCCVQVAV